MGVGEVRVSTGSMFKCTRSISDGVMGMESTGHDPSGRPPNPPAKLEVTPVRITQLATTAPLGCVGGGIRQPPSTCDTEEGMGPPAPRSKPSSPESRKAPPPPGT